MRKSDQIQRRRMQDRVIRYVEEIQEREGGQQSQVL